jgi:hypothetical protein
MSNQAEVVAVIHLIQKAQMEVTQKVAWRAVPGMAMEAVLK